jgi:hypothetical protein
MRLSNFSIVDIIMSFGIRKVPRSLIGTPTISQMTVYASGVVKSEIRSAVGPFASISSRRRWRAPRSAVAPIRPDGLVKAAWTARRRRVMNRRVARHQGQCFGVPREQRPARPFLADEPGIREDCLQVDVVSHQLGRVIIL